MATFMLYLYFHNKTHTHTLKRFKNKRGIEKEIGRGKKTNRNQKKKKASRIISREDKTQHSIQKGKVVGEESGITPGGFGGP